MRVLTNEELGSLAYKLIDLVVKSKFEKEVKERFHTRCKDLYEFLYYSGLFSTFAFTYSKAGQGCVERVFNWLDKCIKGEETTEPQGKAEDLGYAIYTSCLCYLLKEMELDIRKGDLGEVIKIIMENERLPIVESQVLEFAKWLKRFAEAIFK